jgi:hypothetical protein
MANFRVVSAERCVEQVIARYEVQYRNWDSGRVLFDGSSPVDTLRKLRAAEASGTLTPAFVAHLLNKGWVYPTCDVCRLFVDLAVAFEYAGGESSAMICEKCLSAMHVAIAKESIASNPGQPERTPGGAEASSIEAPSAIGIEPGDVG